MVAPLVGLILAALVVWQPSYAAFAATTSNGLNTLQADVLAPPTSLAVAQRCVADPTPTQRGASTTATTTGATLTVPHPGGAVAGDVLVAVVAFRVPAWRGAPSISAPADWTLVRQDRNGELVQAVYYLVVPASGATSSSSWSSNATGTVAGITAYGGADTAAPVNVHSGATGQTAQSVTTTRANVVLVGAFSIAGSGWSSDEASMPATMPQSWKADATSNTVSAAAGRESWPTSGPTGARTVAVPGDTAIAQLVALQPPAKPHITTTWALSSTSYTTGQVFRLVQGGAAQREAALPATTTSQTDGPLLRGTTYSVDVAATYAN